MALHPGNRSCLTPGIDGYRPAYNRALEKRMGHCYNVFAFPAPRVQAFRNGPPCRCHWARTHSASGTGPTAPRSANWTSRIERPEYAGTCLTTSGGRGGGVGWGGGGVSCVDGLARAVRIAYAAPSGMVLVGERRALACNRSGQASPGTVAGTGASLSAGIRTEFFSKKTGFFSKP